MPNPNENLILMQETTDEVDLKDKTEQIEGVNTNSFPRLRFSCNKIRFKPTREVELLEENYESNSPVCFAKMYRNETNDESPSTNPLNESFVHESAAIVNEEGNCNDSLLSGIHDLKTPIRPHISPRNLLYHFKSQNELQQPVVVTNEFPPATPTAANELKSEGGYSILSAMKQRAKAYKEPSSDCGGDYSTSKIKFNNRSNANVYAKQQLGITISSVKSSTCKSFATPSNNPEYKTMVQENKQLRPRGSFIRTRMDFNSKCYQSENYKTEEGLPSIDEIKSVPTIELNMAASDTENHQTAGSKEMTDEPLNSRIQTLDSEHPNYTESEKSPMHNNSLEAGLQKRVDTVTIEKSKNLLSSGVKTTKSKISQICNKKIEINNPIDVLISGNERHAISDTPVLKRSNSINKLSNVDTIAQVDVPGKENRKTIPGNEKNSTSKVKTPSAPQRDLFSLQNKISDKPVDLFVKPCDLYVPNKQVHYSRPIPLNTNIGKIITIKGKEYTIQGKLGVGGSCEVFAALDSKSANSRAIKCVNLAVDPATAKGYLSEIEVLAKLQGSEYVIKLFDWEQINNRLLVVMEKGEVDLAELLGGNSIQPHIPMVIYYWTEMLTAVKYIHEQGIIHSDLKPSNFLLVRGRLKLIDFGIASVVNDDVTSIIKNTQAGTISYISPEALMDTKQAGGDSPGVKVNISFKSDVWSLGCILYKLVYNTTPFHCIINRWARLAAITDRNHKIQFPDKPNCPPKIIHTLKWCLTFEMRKRPSVKELLQIRYLCYKDC